MASKKVVWIARVVSLLVSLVFVFSAVMKLIGGPEVSQGMAHLGLADRMVLPLAILELACVVIYLIPPTAVFGAILLTGYLGGAIYVHVRAGSPLFSHTLFGVYLGLLIWGGLYLRDGMLRALIPLRQSAD